MSLPEIIAPDLARAATVPSLEALAPFLTAFAAFFLGMLLTWLFLRTRLSTERARSEERLRAAGKSVADLEASSARLESELQQLRHTELKLLKSQGELETLVEAQRRGASEKQQVIEAAEARMANAFKTISHESLRNSQEQFLNLARTALRTQQDEARGEIEKRRQAVESMVGPVAESLHQVQSRIGEIEQAREGAYANLHEQVRQLVDVQHSLRQETSQLVRALRQPAGRGQWGEMQLRRAVELSGMSEYCRFLSAETASAAGHDPRLHPDLLVELPAGQNVVIDAKVPMDAYLDALDATDEADRLSALEQHARQLGQHVALLSSPAYQEQFSAPPEFVVMFLPSESILAAALTQDGGLLENGIEQGVILATPTTLIALLRTVAYGWRQESLATDARQIVEVGSELHRRVSTLTEQFANLGQSLDGAVRHYNQTLGSIESHILPNARQLESLGAAPESAALPEGLEAASAPRQPHNVTRADFAGSVESLATTGEVPEDDFEGFAAEDPDLPEADSASPQEPKNRNGAVESLKRAAEIVNGGGSQDKEIEEDGFEGFTDEIEDGGTESEDEEPADTDDDVQEPDAEGAADDLRAALEESKAS
jgi:DNA recombination protein RmuC